MSFLEGDLSELGKFGAIDETNVIEFIDKMVETLSYKLSSASRLEKRKEDSINRALAADALLRFFIDSRYKREDMDLGRIKAIVSSVDETIRTSSDFMGICGSIYHINENVVGDESTSDSAELPGARPGRRDRSRSREQRPRDAITLANFEHIHPNGILVPLSRADRELGDALFDLFSHEKLPRDLRRIVSDQRTTRREWSGIKILELIFNEIDTYKTINVLVENKFHAVQFTGCGKVSELLSTKKKLFERLPKETQRMLNAGKPLEEEIQKTFMLSGREFSSKEKIQYQGLSASVLALILASPRAGVQLKTTCKRILGSSDPREMDYGKVTASLIVSDKLDCEVTAPKSLAVHTLKRKTMEPPKCFNCDKPGHKYWQCKTKLRANLQKKVDAFKAKRGKHGSDAKGDQPSTREE